MAAQEYILCIDVGADSIKASEFICTSQNVELDKFVCRSFPNEADDASAFAAMLAMLKEVIAEGGFKAKDVYLSLTGQNALIPFIKVPAMTTDPEKIKELVTYEAKSRIPYPLNEVVWDYQMIDNPDGGDEIDAMLVSVKNEDVVAIADAVESAGCKIKSIEVSPTALYNSARANGIGDSQCEMILNIGGKASTLVFVDGPRFFVRSIPVAGNTITQQIAKEFNMSFADAEEIKCRHGFVALGGAYEEPESDVAATVSKIVRNVMTRLHGEINRSINVYRATQHGRKPEKMYLAGGSSIMPFTPRFFVEKLRIPVDYFNAFKVVSLGENINQEVLQEQAHLCGETIGLAMRHFRSTPIEISLIPDTIKKQNSLRLKRPFFYASAVSLLVYLGITYWALDKQVGEIGEKEQRLEQKRLEKENTRRGVDAAKRTLRENEKKYEQAVQLVKNRNQFLDVLDQVQEQYKNGKESSKFWFTRISFANEPTHMKVEEDADKTSDRKATRRTTRRSRVARVAARNQQQEAQWLNVEGYILRQSEEDIVNSIQYDLMHSLLNLDAFQMSDGKDMDIAKFTTKNGVVIYFDSNSKIPTNLSEFNFSYRINTQAGK